MESSTISKKNMIPVTIVNLSIFLSTAVVAGMGVMQGAGDGQVGTSVIGLGYFIPYTMDSNIFAGISSLLLLSFLLKSLRTGKNAVPRWAVTFQLMSTACLCVTMIVAAVFLGPGKVMSGESYFSMFQGDMFFFHFLNPVLAIISFSWLIGVYHYRYLESIVAAIPTIIYSFVYLFMVVILKRWEDFYNFTFGGRYYMIPFVFIAIYSIVIVSACILIRLHNRHCR